MSFSGGPVHTKRAPRKQTLTVLVCGASGTGKSAFINSFVGHQVIFESETGAQSSEPVRFVPTTVELDNQLSDGARLALTLVETEGFGTSLSHESDVEAVAKHIEHRFDEVLAEESRIRRNPRFKDSRVDACIYFIEPTTHGLRELDVLTLRRLSDIVNVIPVLARADTLTPSEVVANKRLCVEDFQRYEIEPFTFQYADEAPDAEPSAVYSALPLSITSSSEFSTDGAALFIRKLAYGEVHVLDPQQTDFQLLRDALIDAYLIELKDRTHDVLYENFRTQRLDPKAQHRQSMLLPQQLADHAARLKQAQIERETQLLREQERRVNAEIEAKRQLLAKREQELRELDQKMLAQKQREQQLRYNDSASIDEKKLAGVNNSADVSAPTATSLEPSFDDYRDSMLDPEESSRRLSAGSSVLYHSHLGSQSASESHFDHHVDTRASFLDNYTSPHAYPAEPRSAVSATYPAELDPVPATHTNFSNASVPHSFQHPVASSPYDRVEQRLRQKKSHKELRQHADQLHAELGSLENQRQSIQQQVASVTSMGKGAAASTESLPLSELSTSPLNIKKTN